MNTMPTDSQDIADIAKNVVAQAEAIAANFKTLVGTLENSPEVAQAKATMDQALAWVKAHVLDRL
jgi:hypothetical protein